MFHRAQLLPIYYIHYFKPVDQATNTDRKDWKHGYKRHGLNIPGPSSSERGGRDYTKDSKEKCVGLNEGNLRQRQDQNQSYFHHNSSEQIMTAEKGFLLVVYKFAQGNSFQGMG